MPNHVINELIFHAVDDAAKDRIVAAACNADGRVDFEILAPVPLNVWQGNVGTVHEKAFGRTGLDWQRENWGTKWNAYDCLPVERAADELTIRFQTAWTPPYPWLAAVLNSLSLPFDHNWLSEGGSPSRAGRFKLNGQWGKEWTEEEADEVLHRHLHKLLWGVEEFPDED